jgi:hypothetical protein
MRSATEVRTGAGGQTIECRLQKLPSGPKARGGIVIYLRASAGSFEQWQPLGERLRPGYRVLAPDLVRATARA